MFLPFALALGATSLFALEAAPIRISIAAPPISRWGEKCAKKFTQTYGLDIGAFTAYTCKIAGVQVALGAEAGNLYGLQIGGIASFVDSGYGVQIGGVFTFAFYEYHGIQAAGVVNIARYSLAGAQLGAINISGRATGVQAGLLNIQVDGCSGPLLQVGMLNRTEALNGLQIGIVNSKDSDLGKGWAAQFGIYNHTASIRGLQLGVINRAEKLVGVQVGLVNIVSAKHRRIGLPFTPLVNVSW